jgi:hypothetical protein
MENLLESKAFIQVLILAVFYTGFGLPSAFHFKEVAVPPTHRPAPYGTKRPDESTVLTSPFSEDIFPADDSPR